MNPIDRTMELMAPFPIWPAVAGVLMLTAIALGTWLVLSLNLDIRNADKHLRNQ